MKTRIMAAAIIIVGALAVGIQTTAAQMQEESSPARPNVAGLLEDVNAAAEALESDIRSVGEALAASAASRESGVKALKQMQMAINTIHESLAEGGDIWGELKGTVEIWDQNRQKALEKSETNTAFDQIAREWSVRIEQVGQLRQQILSQRAESMALLQEVIEQEDVILAYYDLDQADGALAAMEIVSNKLGQMNDSMRSIVEQTKVVAGPAVSQ